LANNRGDIVLHVNPRVTEHQLVLNSAPGGNWGGEERKPLNMARGQPFTLIIMVTEQGFKVRFISKKKANIPGFLRLPLIINTQLILIIECHSM